MNSGIDTEGLESGILRYLAANPDFFVRHPHLLDDMTLPHDCGQAVSLLEYQVRRLQNKNRLLHDRVRQMLDAGQANDRLFQQQQQLALELLQIASVEVFFPTLERLLKRQWQADKVAILLNLSSAQPIPAWLTALSPDTENEFNRLWRLQQPYCRTVTSEAACLLFGKGGERVQSVALIPLQSLGWQGLLAIGSCDADRFRADMGTTFLTSIGELVNTALGQFFDSEAVDQASLPENNKREESSRK